jgi:hypothetical protein
MNLNILRKVKLVEEKPKEKKKPMMLDKNSKFVYTKGADVMKIFKRFGFVPPTEYRDDYLFKKNRENLNE